MLTETHEFLGTQFATPKKERLSDDPRIALNHPLKSEMDSMKKWHHFLSFPKLIKSINALTKIVKKKGYPRITMLKCPYPRIFDFSWFYSYGGLENKARTIGSSVAPSGRPRRQKDVFTLDFR